MPSEGAGPQGPLMERGGLSTHWDWHCQAPWLADPTASGPAPDHCPPPPIQEQRALRAVLLGFTCPLEGGRGVPYGAAAELGQLPGLHGELWRVDGDHRGGRGARG